MKRVICCALFFLFYGVSFADQPYTCSELQGVVDSIKIIERASTPAELVKQWQQAKKVSVILAYVYFDHCEINKPWIIRQAADSFCNLITYRAKNENDLNEWSLSSIIRAYGGATNGLLKWKEMTYDGYMHTANMIDSPGEMLARAVEKRNKLHILPPEED